MKQHSTHQMLISTTSTEAFDKHLLNEARLLFKKINELTVRFRAADVHDQVHRQVKRLENYVGQVKDPKTRYYIYKTSDLYCVIYKDPSARIPYLHMMMDIIETDDTVVPEREKALTMFKFGDVLYDEHKIEQAHNFVHKLYREEPKLFKNLLSGYHLLIETAILLGKYDLAEQVLNKEFAHAIKTKEQTYCAFALMNYAKLYLHKGDYEKSLGYLMETKKIHNQIFNPGQEVEIRLYENMCFFLSGDIDFARQLVNANLKFCRAKGLSQRNPRIKQMVDIINDAVTARINSIPVSKDTLTTLKHFQKGTYAIIGKLLTRMASSTTTIEIG